MTELNLNLLKKVLDKIVSDPDDHNQSQWMVVTGPIEPTREVRSTDGVLAGVELSCPTTACVAGWACALAGDVPFIAWWELNRIGCEEELPWGICGCEEGLPYIEQVVTPEGEVHYIKNRAAALLGLDCDVAYDLFDACNTRGYVTNRLSELIKEAERKLL